MTWAPTAADLVDALSQHYLLRDPQPEWSLVTELASVPTTPTRVWTSSRVIDALLVRNWPSGRYPYERIAVEIKISRGDFFRDTADKRAPWEALSHRFAYCVPEGLVTAAEVPDGCWLMEVTEHPCTFGRGHQHPATRVHWNRTVRGARRTNVPMPEGLAVLLARRASNAEQTLRDDDSATVGAVKDNLKRALTRIHVLEDREAEHRRRRQDILALVAPLGPQKCSHCGKTIRPETPRYGMASWKHRTHDDEAACASTRGWNTTIIPKVLADEIARNDAEDTAARAEAGDWRRQRAAFTD